MISLVIFGAFFMLNLVLAVILEAFEKILNADDIEELEQN